MVVKLKNVTKNYNPQGNSPPEIKNVNLEIKDHEIICIIGPSGCGKSTLLNLIAGFLTPTKGEILIGDKKVTGPGPDRGVVFQSSDVTVFPWMTTKENIAFGLEMINVEREKRENLIKEFLGLVNLSGAAKKYPSELSGGMKQRIQIARTLAMDPEILLMDEPFANLDAITRSIMQDELLKIWKKTKKTIYYVTHDITEAAILGSRVAVMSTGPEATIKKIFKVTLERPRSPTSNRFINFRNKLEKQIALEVLKSREMGMA